MIDPLNIFSQVKNEILEVFPRSRIYAYGSRTFTGWKIKKLDQKLDFDFIVCNPSFDMSPSLEHLKLREKFNLLKEKIKDNYSDEFDRPVKADFSFTNAETSKHGIEI